ncbi:hypothetical protein ACN38_g5818 [Penicillium nordicum]|uniref:Uncharacterized protein n=1 Tax=Penicillium nordicum TaxID=229535 RepID=A0A0M9WFU9_9EURO|nr:hypothetical protein ACN38_g5818 [Penicillium nordicum]
MVTLHGVSRWSMGDIAKMERETEARMFGRSPERHPSNARLIFIDYQYQIKASEAFQNSAEQIMLEGRTASFSVRGVIAISSNRKHPYTYIALEILSRF